jgi:hypothetical protein
MFSLNYARKVLEILLISKSEKPETLMIIITWFLPPLFYPSSVMFIFVKTMVDILKMYLKCRVCWDVKTKRCCDNE